MRSPIRAPSYPPLLPRISPPWLPASANLSFQHRRVAGGEIYLVTNWGERFSGEVSFPHAELGPEIWDADTGACLPAGQYRVAEGRTAVAVALEPH